MLFPARDHWSHALERIRGLLAVEDAMADLMEGSLERILRARDLYERAMPRATGRSRLLHEPPPSPGGVDLPAPQYLAIVLGADCAVTAHKLPAHGDDEARALAQARAEGRPVDLWDGLRFVDCFDPVAA